MTYFHQAVYLLQGTRTVHLPTALNVQAGTWVMDVAEVVSGMKSQIKVAMKPRTQIEDSTQANPTEQVLTWDVSSVDRHMVKLSARRGDCLTADQPCHQQLRNATANIIDNKLAFLSTKLRMGWMVVRQSIQSQHAYARLRPMLLNGQLIPGNRLREVEWANRLAVHRGALREAMALLAHEGLLRVGERGGYFVAVFDATDFEEVLELRASLETGALLRLARRQQRLDISALQATLATMGQLLDQGMPLGFVEADRRFHEQIMELAGNARMLQAYQHSPMVITADPKLADTHRVAAMKLTLQEHEAIFHCIESGDFLEAAGLLERHLTRRRPVAVP